MNSVIGKKSEKNVCVFPDFVQPTVLNLKIFSLIQKEEALHASGGSSDRQVLFSEAGKSTKKPNPGSLA